MAGKLSAAEQERFGVDSYYDRGTTKTKANSTLFVAFRDATIKVAAADRGALCERLFSECVGYVGVRQVRGMCFIDFAEIKSATAAMMRHQGHDGLTIDYDKDTGVAGKRQREGEQMTQQHQREAQSASYYCATCGTKALRTKDQLLSAMPARSTDGARVVDEASALLQLLLEPTVGAQPALLKREKGTERQYRLGCRSCAAVIAYRSVPQQTNGKHLYVDPSAVRERPPTQEEMQQRQQQRQRRDEGPPQAVAGPSGAEAASSRDV